MSKLLPEIWRRVGKCHPIVFFFFSFHFFFLLSVCLKMRHEELLAGFNKGTGKRPEEGGRCLAATSATLLADAQGWEKWSPGCCLVFHPPLRLPGRLQILPKLEAGHLATPGHPWPPLTSSIPIAACCHPDLSYSSRAARHIPRLGFVGCFPICGSAEILGF